MELSLLSISVIMAFLIRVSFLIYAGSWGSFSSDANLQMKLIKEIRNNNHRIPYRLNQFLTSGYMAYPFLLYWFFSFWPDKVVKSIRPFFGAFVDAFFVIIIYTFSYYYLTTIEFSDNAQQIAFIASLLFATTPFLVRADGRSFSINGRAFGGLVYTLSMIFLFRWQLDSNIGWFLGAVFCGSLVFLSSKFAVQAFILINFVLSIFCMNFIYLLLPFLSFLGAVALSGGTYLRIFKGHLNHLFFYYTTLQYKHLFVLAIRSPWFTLKQAFKAIKAGHIRNFFVELYRIPLIKLLTHLPLLFPCFILFYNYKTICETILFKWLMSSLIIFLIISIPKFSFIGEAERYLEYAILPITLFTAMWLYTLNNLSFVVLIGVYFVFCLCLISANFWAAVHFKAGSKNPKAEKDLINLLRKYSTDKLRILTIPTLLGRRIALETPHCVVEHAGNMATTTKAREDFNLIYPRYYDLPNMDLSLLCQKFQINTIIANHRWLKERNFYNDYDFSRFEKFYDNQEFTAYSVNWK